MRTPTSTIYRIALYLYHEKRMITFTGRDLYDNRENAKAYFESQIPASVFTEESLIIERHGFTRESWRNVLADSATFYFCPTDEMIACNREIKQLFAPYRHINAIPYQRNYLYAKLSNAVRRNVIHHVLTVNRRRVYRINPAYLPKED